MSANWRTTWQPEEDAIVAADGHEHERGTRPAHALGCDARERDPPDRRPRARSRGARAGRAVALVEGVTTAPDYFVIGTGSRSSSAPESRRTAARDGGRRSGRELRHRDRVERRATSRARERRVASRGKSKGGAYPTIVTFYPGRESNVVGQSSHT